MTDKIVPSPLAALAGIRDGATVMIGGFVMESLGVDALFTPENPVVSKKGAVVTNIAHIPAAPTAVMALSGAKPDFPRRGSLSLKPWLANDQGLSARIGVSLPKASWNDAGALCLSRICQLCRCHQAYVSHIS